MKRRTLLGRLATGISVSVAVFTALCLVLPGETVAQKKVGTGAELAWPDATPADCPFEKSAELTGIVFTGRYANHTGTDGHAPFWADNDKLYSAGADGACVNHDGTSQTSNQHGPHWAIFEGDDPNSMITLDCGIVRTYGYPSANLYFDGVWYFGAYRLHHNNAVLGHFDGWYTSSDEGKTWTNPPTTLFPLETDWGKCATCHTRLGAPRVVDFGKNLEHSPDGKVYLIGHGGTRPEATVHWITGDQCYMARCAPPFADNLNNPDAWEFLAGHDDNGDPIWSGNYDDLKPLLEWNTHFGSMSITYNAPLKKYILNTTRPSDGVGTFEKFDTYFMESDNLTGPYKMITYMKDLGEQAYFVNVHSKFISSDGMTAWMGWAANYANWAGGKNYQAIPNGSSYAWSLHEFKFTGDVNVSAKEAEVAHEARAHSRPMLLPAFCGNRNRTIEVPAGATGVEVLDARGRRLWQAELGRRASGATVSVPVEIARRGMLFVRVRAEQ